MRRLPIRLRVTLAFAGVMAILLVALGVFIYARFEEHLSEQSDQSLRSRADDVAALVVQTNGHPGKSGTLLGREESFAQILTPDGKVVASTPQLAQHPQLTPAEAARAAQSSVLVTRNHVRSLEGQARLLARPVQFEGRTFVVLVSSSIDDRNESLKNLSTILLIGGPVALLLASLAGYFMAGEALRPVEAMRRRAAEVSAAEPDQRLPVPEGDDELTRLGETLNEMLGRLETALERERTFVDDASHELRTPLALHKTELELALRYGKTPEELRDAIASAVDEVDRLIQLAEDLLVVARSEQGKLALELRSVPLAAVFDGVRERFSARASAAGRSLVVEAADDPHVDADRLRLEQALTNLVDNALRYGGGEVRLRVNSANGLLELHVEDSGPGFPPEFLEHAFERFSRADSSRGSAGTGLGLAIVEAIARAHRGTARASNRPEGGADVWIELPADDG